MAILDVPLDSKLHTKTGGDHVSLEIVKCKCGENFAIVDGITEKNS